MNGIVGFLLFLLAFFGLVGIALLVLAFSELTAEDRARELDDALRRCGLIPTSDGRPLCSRCDEPMREVYVASAPGKPRLRRGRWDDLPFDERHDPLVRWLCADCTDEVAARLEGGI